MAQTKPTLEQLAQIGHGAIQVGSNEEAKLVFIAGPIKHWWILAEDQWMKGMHLAYVNWRDAVEASFVKAGFLVFRPYAALRGSWSDLKGQSINDWAISQSDVLVDLSPIQIPNKGTQAEVEFAKTIGVEVIRLPAVGTTEQIEAAVEHSLDIDLHRD